MNQNYIKKLLPLDNDIIQTSNKNRRFRKYSELK